MITENIVYRTNTEIKNPVYSEYGDVLIPASDTTPTGLARATSLEKSGVLLGGDINIIRPNKGINGSCLSLALNANRKELIRLIKGTTVRHIHNSEIKDIVICLPKLETEQVRISSYFKRLDHLITLHQRKSFYNIANINVWEQRKLGDMMDVTSVKRIHQSDWTDSGVRFLRARDIVAESKNEEVSEPLFISQEKYDEYSAISGKVEKGDLLVTGVGTIGVPMLINSEEPLYFKDGNIIWFKNKNTIDGRFFYHSFNGLNIQKFIKESAGTGTVGTYTIETGKKTPINLPPQKEEQEKIGLYFSNLDNLITLHRRAYHHIKRRTYKC